MANIAELARLHSRAAGQYIVLIQTENGGSGHRYSAFEPFGEDAASALAEEDIAFLSLNSHDELIPMIQKVVANVEENASVLTCEVTAFENGEQVYSTYMN